MQGTGAYGRKRIIFEIFSACLIILLVALDQITKYYFANAIEYGQDIPVIDGFFYFTYVQNKGAAWSFLSDATWGQTFFKILTGVSLIAFAYFYWYSSKKQYKWLKIALAFAIGGTIGNFIDRLINSAVIDFIGFTFGTYNFPIFNLADSFLVVGVIMIFVHLFFLDESAIFKRENAKDDTKDN